MKKLNVIITGATGMVGEGVLKVCLESDLVKKVLVITRRPVKQMHEKLFQLLHKDFYNLEPVRNELDGYDACFFCSGVSSIGKSEKEYFSLTHTLTMGFAGKLAEVNPGMVFCYVSGAGTKTNEKGQMWARVKGKTENDLQTLDLQVYNYRPAFMKPHKGAKNVPNIYRSIGWLHYIGKLFAPDYFGTTENIGRSMLYVTQHGYDNPVLEVKDIRETAGKL